MTIKNISHTIAITVFLLFTSNIKSQINNSFKKNIEFFKNKPPMQGDPGFFLDDWKEKKNPKISLSKKVITIKENPTTYTITDFSKPLTKISKYIFGNNLGHWTNRKFLEQDEFIFNLKDIGIQVVRFPGGNAANDYFWDASELNQCPDGTPEIIYKSNFKKTTSPKLGTQGNYRTRPEDYYELLLRTK